MAERWTFRHLEAIPDRHNLIEVFTAIDNTYAEQDMMVLRITEADNDIATELWLGADAIKPLVSVLEANRPGQLQLFDQDAMP